MKRRILGQTGLEVSEIGLGGFPISGMWKREDGSDYGWTGVSDDESIQLIHRAEELGINLVDSAEAYGDGHSEVVVGKALKGRRDRWVVATKVSPNRGLSAEGGDADDARKVIVSACEASLRRLDMATVDLYQLHAIPHAWSGPYVMEALESLRESGKIRHYGISTNSRRAIEGLMAHGSIDVLQIGYNLLEREADSLLHWAREQGIGTLIRVPLAKGMLTGKYFGKGPNAIPENDVRFERFQRPETLDALQKLPRLEFLQTAERSMVQAALRFVLDHPGVSCAIAGAKSVEQIEQNAAASDLPSLTREETERAIEAAEDIRTPGWSQA